MNFGAGKGGRSRETLRLALGTTAFFGPFWTALSMACPNLYIRIFMAPTQPILEMTLAIIRTYAWSFLLLPVNFFSTYYFQAIMRPKAAFIVSVARGLVISGTLILGLPALAGADSLWSAMPIYRKIVLPLIRPALATVAIYNLVPIWNDLWFPLIFINVENQKTVLLAVTRLQGQYTTDWPKLLTILSLSALPVILLYLTMSKQFVKGLTTGAVKG